MPSVLSDDFTILAGSVPQTAMPGAAGGRFADLATLNKNGTLALIYRPDVPGGTRDVFYASVTDTTPNDVNKATLSFVLPAPYNATPQVVVVEKSPAGSPNVGGTPVVSKVHRVDFSGCTLWGQFVLRFFDGYRERRAIGWRHPA